MFSFANLWKLIPSDWKKKMVGPTGVAVVLIAALAFSSFKLLKENARLRAALDAKPQTKEVIKTVEGPTKWKERKVIVYKGGPVRTEIVERESETTGKTSETMSESKPMSYCKPRSWLVGYAAGDQGQSFPHFGYSLDKASVFVGPLVEKGGKVGAMAGFNLKF